MGNPHAVQIVPDVGAAPRGERGSTHRAPPAVSAARQCGLHAEIVDRGHIRLRVYERGAGETLSCGTGACAAVVAGVMRGLLNQEVKVETRGGDLGISWAGGNAPVMMTGPAVAVYEGEIEI